MKIDTQEKGPHCYWPRAQLTRSQVADLAEADIAYQKELYNYRPIQGHDMPEYKDAN